MAQFYPPCTGLGIYSSCETEDKILRSLSRFWHLEEEHGRNHIHMLYEKKNSVISCCHLCQLYLHNTLANTSDTSIGLFFG